MASVQMSGLVARVIVEDVSAARVKVLASSLEAGVPLRRFEVVTPSLEDIFLRLVRTEGRTA